MSAVSNTRSLEKVARAMLSSRYHATVASASCYTYEFQITASQHPPLADTFVDAVERLSACLTHRRCRKWNQ